MTHSAFTQGVLAPIGRTQRDLAPMHCTCTDHEPGTECRGLYFHSACHPQSPTWTLYDKVTGTATVECAECGQEIIVLRIAP